MKPFKSGDRWYAEKATTKKPRLSNVGPANPLNVEFSTGRLDPALKEYADELRTAYLLATNPHHGHDFVDLAEFSDMAVNEDQSFIRLGGIENTAPIYDPADAASPSLTGAHLIYKLIAPEPVELKDIAAEQGKLIGAEIGMNAKQVCQWIKFRAAHLYDPTINAVVFRHTMAEIGRTFGGNSQDSARTGREKVKDGLLFAKLAFDALIDCADGDGSVFGQMASNLPASLLAAANDNRRRIADVA